MSPGSFRLRQKAGIRYWSLPVWRRLGCQVVFSCRQGGVSRPPFASLNLGLGTRDRREKVLDNRRRFFKAAGLGPMLPVVARQTHEAQIREVGRKDAGKGWRTLRTAFRRTDGLITSVPGLPVAITIADCLPILLADSRGRAVAAVHAGWRGLTKGVISAAIETFQTKYGILPGELQAAIGPSIGPGAFTVKGEALKLLRKILPAAVKHSGNKPGARFDLWKAAVYILKKSGIRPKNIFVLRQCTGTQPKLYFSHRSEGETGRMLGVIQILSRPTSR